MTSTHTSIPNTKHRTRNSQLRGRKKIAATMRKATISLPLLCLMFLLVVEGSQDKFVPALYIFGDSTLDAGNNNFLDTKAKGNYFPYGIDHPLGTTGRFTNGRTMADFFAEWLGLHYQPPFVQAPKAKADINSVEHIEEPVAGKSYEGFNYASGSAGILDETGSSQGINLSLEKQVRLFRQTAEEHLPGRFNTTIALGQHLAKSIFLVSIGANDYALNFMDVKKINISRPRDPEKFTDLLVNELGNHLQVLHQLGARKIVVSDLAAYGCCPGALKAANITKPGSCADKANALADVFNSKLAMKLQELNSKFNDSTFVQLQAFGLTYDVFTNPSRFGIRDSNYCCVPGPFGPCVAKNAPCKDRNFHAFFDSVHPSEATYKIVADQCFRGAGVCVPLNVQALARK